MGQSRSAQYSCSRGASPSLGRISFDGADAALQLVNDEGGIGGRKLTWIKADGSTPEEAASQAERMIESLWRAHHYWLLRVEPLDRSIESLRASRGCTVGSDGMDRDVVRSQTPNTFRTNTFATPVEEAAVDYVLANALPRIGKSKEQARIVVINEGSAYGMSCGEETIKALRSRGVEPAMALTYDARYDGSSLDFDALVAKIYTINPHVLFASSFIRDLVGILQAMRRAAWRPPIIMTSSAGFGLYTLNLAGDMADGILSANAPAFISPATLGDRGRRLQREYVSRLKGLTGREPSGFNAMAFCAAYSLFNDVLHMRRRSTTLRQSAPQRWRLISLLGLIRTVGA